MKGVSLFLAKSRFSIWALNPCPFTSHILLCYLLFFYHLSSLSDQSQSIQIHSCRAPNSSLAAYAPLVTAPFLTSPSQADILKELSWQTLQHASVWLLICHVISFLFFPYAHFTTWCYVNIHDITYTYITLLCLKVSNLEYSSIIWVYFFLCFCVFWN